MATEDFSHSRREGRDLEPLLERSGALAELGGLLAIAKRGHGRVTVIEGPAGIGKTALLDHTRARAKELGLTVLAARGGELERDFGFGIVRQLLEPMLARAGEDERAELTAGAARLAAPVLAAFVEGPEPGVEDPDAVLHGLYWLVANIAERKPVLLTIDDAHWADHPSFRFLIYLTRRLEGLPATIVLGIRSGEDREGHDLLRLLEVEAEPLLIRPAPLSEAAVKRIVETRFSAAAGIEFSRLCHVVTRGNPFLVTALVDELSREGRRPGEIDPEAVRSFASERIAAAVLLRVGRLGHNAPALARAVAVIGERADLGHAAALAGLDRAEATAEVDALTRAGVLERGRPLRFVHPLVRTAIHGDIPEGERAALHKRAAHVLAEAGAEPESIALHLLSTEPAGDNAVVEGLREGAQAALSRGAPEIASRYLRRALSEPPPDAVRSEVLLEAGSAAARAGEPDGIGLMRDAFELAGDPRARATAARELGPVLMYAGRVDEEVDVFERGLDRLHDLELATPLEALLLLAGVTTASARRRVRGRLRAARSRVAGLPTDQARPMLVPVAVDVAVTGGTAAEAAELAERALAGGDLVRGPMGDSPFAYTAAFILARAGQPKLVERAMDEAATEARERGSVTGLAFALAFRALARLRVGELAAAGADASGAVELAAEAGLGIPLTNAAAVASAVLIERAELARAREVLERVKASSHDPEALPSTPLRESRARVMIAEGDPASALAELGACSRWEEECGAPTVVPVAWRSWAALAELSRGRADEARRLAGEEVEIARRFGAARPVGVALRAAGLVEGGERGTELLAEAVSVLESAEDRLEHARALVDLGAALRRSGARTDARERLETGMELAHRCGATALVERASEELQVAGARPRRAALTGVESLTASELRVSGMAADGMTNPEIAQALFVTQRTVEMHLSNAYRKLGIDSRRELPVALGEGAEPAAS